MLSRATAGVSGGCASSCCLARRPPCAWPWSASSFRSSDTSFASSGSRTCQLQFLSSRYAPNQQHSALRRRAAAGDGRRRADRRHRSRRAWPRPTAGWRRATSSPAWTCRRSIARPWTAMRSSPRTRSAQVRMRRGRSSRVDRVFTGQMPARALARGECIEIATGAPMPDGADAVVMVEETERADPAGRRDPRADAGLSAPARRPPRRRHGGRTDGRQPPASVLTPEPRRRARRHGRHQRRGVQAAVRRHSVDRQ